MSEASAQRKRPVSGHAGGSSRPSAGRRFICPHGPIQMNAKESLIHCSGFFSCGPFCQCAISSIPSVRYHQFGFLRELTSGSARGSGNVSATVSTLFARRFSACRGAISQLRTSPSADSLNGRQVRCKHFFSIITAFWQSLPRSIEAGRENVVPAHVYFGLDARGGIV
jgi:hypothetical protein